MGATGHSDKGKYTGASTAPPGGVLRRLPDRLGSCPRGRRRQWSLARTVVDAAHQPPGTESNISGSSTLPVSSEEPPCPGEDRQHSGCGVCQQAGGLGLPSPLQTGTDDVGVDAPPIQVPEGNVCARSDERCGDRLSRGGPLTGEWRLHPQVVEEIWNRFGTAVADLFALRETTH